MQSSTQDISAQIKNDLLNLGFSEVGFSKAEKLNEEDHLSKWLEAGYHGNMKYMEDHFEKRLDPRALLPGTKSLVSLLYNYYPEKELENKKYKIGKEI